MTTSFASCPLTTSASAARRGPVRQASAASRLASVADSPQTGRFGRAPKSRASASSTWTPRLVDSNSCHSSTTTAESSAQRARQSARASSSVRLSGVVTSTVGSCRSCRARADAGVSPVRVSTRQCGRSAAAARASAWPVSAASARSGVIQSSESGGGLAALPAGPSTSGGIATASVLPMPVGACTSPERPAANAAQVASWKANGANPCAANHARAVAKRGSVAAGGRAAAQPSRSRTGRRFTALARESGGTVPCIEPRMAARACGLHADLDVHSPAASVTRTPTVGACGRARRKDSRSSASFRFAWSRCRALTWP